MGLENELCGKMEKYQVDNITIIQIVCSQIKQISLHIFITDKLRLYIMM